jgi:thiamine pyrophosphate-dependent acetolactate synthase large subunit-like protein
MKLHAALARALAGHGVRTMFGLAGEANNELVRSFEADGGDYLAAAHEAGAMAMGFGYASVTQQLGVVTVAYGPALTHALTGLVEGVRGRLPILLIAGDHADLRDIPQGELVLPTGAGFEQARTPETTLADLAGAMRRALIERRPVVFTVPAGFPRADVGYENVPLDLREPRPNVPDPVDVQRVAREIASAERPVLLAGFGAIGARSSVLRLAERIGAPMATTLKAKDLFRGEPFDMEVAGGLAGPASRAIFDRADLVVCVGLGFDESSIRRGAGLSGQRLVLIDAEDDPEPGARATVQGDVDAVIDTLIGLLDAPPSEFRNAAMAASLARQAATGCTAEPPPTAPGTIDLTTALCRLDAVLPQRRVVVDDGGRFLLETLRHLHPGDPRAYVLPVNFGSAGMGMGAAVGAAVGRPGEPVIMVCADGGFMHGGMGEFATAARYGLDVIVIVCDDGGLEMAPLAKALGGDGVTVRGVADLERAAEAIANRTRPLLIDLRLEGNPQ